MQLGCHPGIPVYNGGVRRPYQVTTLMDRRQFLLAVPPIAAIPQPNEKVSEFHVDGKTPGAPIRPLHGVNGGPLAAGGLLDLSARWKEAGFPIARLHDCHWPNPDVVDVSAIFPDPTADPARPASYDFDRTDEYVQAVHDTGAAIVYRLGESIEHQKVKRRVRPPKNSKRWADVCAGIVRHYTEGWAKGFKLPIRYWEIWNEPDNRPACWTGNDEEFFELYTTTAKLLRAQFPKLKIGGPGLGNTGKLNREGLEPTEFLKAFLTRCVKDAAPLDFLSWHCYSDDPSELVRRTKGVRKLLDSAGFKATESHLNEWNYLPGNDWAGMLSQPSARHTWYDRINGAEGAAFALSSLIQLQDAPVDVACYFTAEAPGMGLFSPHGFPSRIFHALRYLGRLTNLKRLPCKSDIAGVTSMAGLAADSRNIRVLLSRPGGESGVIAVEVDPPFDGPFAYEVMGIDQKREDVRIASGKLNACKIEVDLPRDGIRHIRFWQEK